jgi:hypothetical protein
MTFLLSETTAQSEHNAPANPADSSGVNFHFGLSAATPPTYSLCATVISAALLIMIVRRVSAGPVGSSPSE